MMNYGGDLVFYKPSDKHNWEHLEKWLELEGGKGLAIDVNDARMRIANEIKKCRLEKDLTQYKLGSLTGLHQERISEIETGKLNVRLGNLLKVLAVFGKTIEVVPLKDK